MKKYIITISIFLLLCGQVWGATYYLRADGDNSDPDCSEGAACCAECMDASDFNAASFNGDDR